MDKDYPWYELVDGYEPLMQGDFIDACPIVVPSLEIFEKRSGDIEVICYDVVIMSQSCDLVYKKVDLVLVCPFYPLNEFEKTKPFYRSEEGKEALRRGYAPSYHLLNKCEIGGFETDHLVVDFRNVYGVPLKPLVILARRREKRLRLLPPYREHLSQAFARFFMRVGLPVDIPPFSKRARFW